MERFLSRTMPRPPKPCALQNRYVAKFWLNDQVIYTITGSHYDKLCSKVVLVLEEKFPDSICRITEIKKGELINEFKRRSYYE